MKRMTIIQKIKLIFQNMKLRLEIVFLYLFISAFLMFFMDAINVLPINLLIFIILFISIFILHLLFHIIEILGILIKKVYLIDGVVCKTYSDYKHGDAYGGTGRRLSYEKKYISLFSKKVKSRNVPIPFQVRIKVESNDKKYISPWCSIKKRIFKNINNYKFMIIIYNNISVAVYREKK